ncbi:glycosyl transferase family 1 [Oceanihabitans sediminis]|uniref:Glycosyltransferase family 1 protein n=1 Tax=Oceanihabitans sediminis TaxID=1812012 RepID=A0A368P0V2_9FLAO|nr:glycosyltransferase [Oceanihabitans sediminis]MDX1774725.1 glycosyltransferase [Oceanihabitans sediminis]RBP27630.1 glycosyl transferase family 1 [Oceanihabitans sediminis]RCU56477.1 glycosyltransferase family 1 protein [Oceanihabitans sediminis]
MKILLIGEYSRLHNSLKEGLKALGHQVTIAGFGDDFKNYPVDIRFKNPYSKGIPLFIKKVIYKLTGTDLSSVSIEKQFHKHKSKLVNFDIVQLINENPFSTLPKTEARLLEHLFRHNKKVYLLSCGADYVSVNFAFDKKFRYSIYTPYENNKVSKSEYWNILKWKTEPFKLLHLYVFNNVDGIISSDLDYHLPLLGYNKYLGLIPNPININKITLEPVSPTDKLVIFHGINDRNYYKKGNDIFDAALEIIKSIHGDKVEVIEARSLPYEEYIESYNTAHILLDQVYAYDQGYNALEAMAKGKVVFTGAEQEWLNHYNLEEDTVAINALPDAEKIAEKLEWLILHPEKIAEISKNARAFIEKEHHYILIAKKYIDTWSVTDKYF